MRYFVMDKISDTKRAWLKRNIDDLVQNFTALHICNFFCFFVQNIVF